VRVEKRKNRKGIRRGMRKKVRRTRKCRLNEEKEIDAEGIKEKKEENRSRK
jgi:hypothetical protein